MTAAATCNICDGDMGEPVYASADAASITTMGSRIDGQTTVYFCGRCGHLKTPELPNLSAFYAEEYEINLGSDDEDQLYEVVDGRKVSRSDKQAEVIRQLVAFPPGAQVLDYGCANAATLRKVVAAMPGIVPHAFDVTDKYTRFWDVFIDPSNTSCFELKPEWDGRFDVVMSLYALEHIADLQPCVATLHRLLKPDGTLCFVVPNVYQNIADFVVADHVNHFSEHSLRYLLSAGGFTAIRVDASVFRAAFVVTATPGGDRGTPVRGDVTELQATALEMAAYWSRLRDRIVEAECAAPARSAIYGAGFYGNYILSCLEEPARVACIVDQNEHLQGRQVGQIDVVAPDALPGDVERMYVGLNPTVARNIIEDAPIARKAQLEFVYL